MGKKSEIRDWLRGGLSTSCQALSRMGRPIRCANMTRPDTRPGGKQFVRYQRWIKSHVSQHLTFPFFHVVGGQPPAAVFRHKGLAKRGGGKVKQDKKRKTLHAYPVAPHSDIRIRYSCARAISRDDCDIYGLRGWSGWNRKDHKVRIY